MEIIDSYKNRTVGNSKDNDGSVIHDEDEISTFNN